MTLPSQMTIYEIEPSIELNIDLGSHRPDLKALSAARQMVDLLDRTAHISKLSGLIIASESEEHRPELVKYYGSDGKVNEVVYNSKNHLEHLEATLPDRFAGLLATLGIINSTQPTKDNVAKFNRAWFIFFGQFAGPDGRVAREKSVITLNRGYKQAIGQDIPRPFREVLKQKQEDNRPLIIV